MPAVTVSDGAKVNYYLDDFTDPWEESDTIIMLHGAAETARLFYRLVPGFAMRYRVIRLDERGMGESSLPPGGYKPSLERFAEDVLNVMDHFGIPKCHLFGNKSGGWVGMAFSIAHPERVKSLIMCNTPYKEPVHLSSRLSLGEKDVPTAIRKFGFRNYLFKGGGTTLDSDPGATPKMVEWFLNEKGNNPTDVVAARYKFAFETGFDYWERLPEIKVPTLIITGSNSSGHCPPEMAVAMQQRIPNAQVSIIENVAGYVAFMMPDRCVEAVINFHRALTQ